MYSFQANINVHYEEGKSEFFIAVFPHLCLVYKFMPPCICEMRFTKHKSWKGNFKEPTKKTTFFCLFPSRFRLPHYKYTFTNTDRLRDWIQNDKTMGYNTEWCVERRCTLQPCRGQQFPANRNSKWNKVFVKWYKNLQKMDTW